MTKQIAVEFYVKSMYKKWMKNGNMHWSPYRAKQKKVSLLFLKKLMIKKKREMMVCKKNNVNKKIIIKRWSFTKK